MAELALEELSAKTIVAVNNLTLRPGQEQFVQPPSYAMADSYLDPSTSWARVVLDGDQVVGFVRGNFDPDAEKEQFRSCVWRVSVEADAQGSGVGRFAVQALADEAKRRGNDRLTAIWEAGDLGPEQFFLALGFEIVGQTEYGEHLGALKL